MESNAVILKPELLLRFMLYTSPTRTNAIPVTDDIWTERKMALEDYLPGTAHSFRSLIGECEDHHYVVAMLPFVRQIPHPIEHEQLVTHVTIYFALASDWHRFKSVDELTPEEIRRAMFCLNEN